MNRLALAAAAGGALLVLAAPGGRPAAGATPEPGAPELVWPVSRFVLTQGFGCTDFEAEPVDLECPGGRFHAGLDLAAPTGTPVRAAATAVVTAVRADATGYGRHAVLDHGGGLTSLYGHLDSIAVRAGDLVLAGQPIGAVGSTGNSTGPHLHFELRRAGGAIDPAGRLPAHHQPEGGNQ